MHFDLITLFHLVSVITFIESTCLYCSVLIKNSFCVPVKKKSENCFQSWETMGVPWSVMKTVCLFRAPVLGTMSWMESTPQCCSLIMVMAQGRHPGEGGPCHPHEGRERSAFWAVCASSLQSCPPTASANLTLSPGESVCGEWLCSPANGKVRNLGILPGCSFPWPRRISVLGTSKLVVAANICGGFTWCLALSDSQAGGRCGWRNGGTRSRVSGLAGMWTQAEGDACIFHQHPEMTSQRCTGVRSRRTLQATLQKLHFIP